MALYRCGVAGGGEDIEFIAPTFDSANTYNKGDMVLYNGLTYICNTDDTTGAWASAKWDRDYLANMNSNSGGIPPKLLWTNPSPTSAFAAQTISLDLSNFDGVIIEGNSYTSSADKGFREYIKIGETKCGGRLNLSNTAGGSRPFTVTNTGVSVGNSMADEGLNNNMSIPTKIYGVTGQNVDLGGDINIISANRTGNAMGVPACIRIDMTKYKTLTVTNVNGGNPSYIHAYNTSTDMINGKNYTALSMGNNNISALSGNMYLLVGYSSIPANTEYENNIRMS